MIIFLIANYSKVLKWKQRGKPVGIAGLNWEIVAQGVNKALIYK
ncbi:hypothetical protein SBDP1_480035 [Syntrophobacter sp. SbD1]|nr:hypothetical protein SBDP1_480035 [Syntrophobacter sp. SbD1]